MEQRLEAHGKFLLTGEYLVLHGARALAVPLQFGQQLIIRSADTPGGLLEWESYVYNKPWFAATFDQRGFSLIKSSDTAIAERLQQVFLEAQKLNNGFLNNGESLKAEIRADFNLQWGLGSSSTLVYLVARWAGVDPYLLLEKTFGGSGYDIACAGSDSALFYTRQSGPPRVEPVSWKPAFRDQLFFIYLGTKMNSRTGMAHFREHARFGPDDMARIADLGVQWIQAATIEELEAVVNEHEARMSQILQLPAVKESRFADYPYALKSLGAWGGDFIMATGRQAEAVKSYFHAKGLDTIFSFGQIIRS